MWMQIDTVRCTRCAVFQPSDDILYASNGSTYCGSCGPPPVSISPIAIAPRRSPLAIAAGICAAIFVAVVTIAQLASLS